MFTQSEKALIGDSLPVHFDEKKQIILACDTSQYGLGAILLHVIDDGKEHPVAYASRTLTPAEKNYSQLEKEGLAIIFSIKNFTIICLFITFSDTVRSSATVLPF